MVVLCILGDVGLVLHQNCFSDNSSNELLRIRLDLGVGYGGDYCVHILVIFVCVVYYV